MIKHILKETNSIADRIVKMITANAKGIHVLPKASIKLLDNDKISGAFNFSI